MRRINTTHKAADLFGPGKDGFRNGDIGLGIMPTELNAEWFNAMQEEIAAVIESTGLTLNSANSAQLLEAIKRMIDIQAGNYALDTGAANAYVIALDPTIAAYTNGMVVHFRAVNANTGASTLNAGGGAVALVNDVGAALVAGDIPSGAIISATYDTALDKFLINSLVPSQALSEAFANGLYAKINTGKSVGEIFTHLGNAAPAGSLAVPIAATSISRAAYASLHAFCAGLGYPWGAGDGSTTFGMPYLAADYALVQSNANLRTLTVGANLLHTHIQDAHTHTQNAHDHQLGYSPGPGGGTNYLIAAPGNPLGGYVASNGTTATNQNTTATNQNSGGSANLAAGMRVLLCVQYQ